MLTCLVLLYLGRELSAGNNIIADVLIYFVVLNFLLVQVRSFSSSVTKVRVFQPFAERYANFLDSLKHLESDDKADFVLTGARDETGSIVPERTLSPGERIGAVYSGALDKIAVGEIYYSLGAGFSPCLAPYVAQYNPHGSGQTKSSRGRAMGIATGRCSTRPAMRSSLKFWTTIWPFWPARRKRTTSCTVVSG